MISVRTCNYCHKILPATPTYFVRRASGKDGLRNLCRECQRQQNRPEYKQSVKTIIQMCEHCGKEFSTTNSRQVYCSLDCRVICQRIRKAQRQKLRYYRGLPAKGDYLTPSNLAQPTGLSPSGCRW